jgi:small conductance mechanosensitive channel
VSLPAALARLLAAWTSLDAELVAVVTRLVALAVTLTALLVLARVVERVIARVVGRLAGVPGVPLARAQRLRTIGSLLVNVTRWAAAFVVLVVVLRELGVDVQALLVSAGLVGLAVGLGAQSLIRDLVTGVFLLFEGLIAVGDLVEVGGHRGTVDSIGIRVTRLRLVDGAVRVVPNGAFTEFTNLSSDWARAVVDVGVPREVDVDRALAVLRQVGEEWAAATGTPLESPRAHGIIRFAGPDAVLRLMVAVDPARRQDAEMDLRRRIRAAFDRERWALVGVASPGPTQGVAP